jgi:predicted nucleotidyltransferase
LANEGIEVLFVQGSVASDSTDEFSDIDFRVVVQPESVDGGEAKGE